MKLREMQKNCSKGNGKFNGRLVESRALQKLEALEKKGPAVNPDEFFQVGMEIAEERILDQKKQQAKNEKICSIYSVLDPGKQERVLKKIYNRFADSYDPHMKETGHYAAIHNLLVKAVVEPDSPQIRVPVLDMTAGTGEPLSQLIGLMKTVEEQNMLQYLQSPYEVHSEPDVMSEYCGRLEHLFYANELSPNMLAKARAKIAKLMDNDDYPAVGFVQGSAYDLPKEMRGEFNTVLCSQTFHLIPDKDKKRLVLAIRGALADGGIALVVEEDPFMITETSYIKPFELLIGSVAEPIRHVGTLIAYFENNGFRRIDRFVKKIYPEKETDNGKQPEKGEALHEMRLHVFRKLG